MGRATPENRGERGAMGEFWPVPDVLAYLSGAWRAERAVRDLASGDEGRFLGTVEFGPIADGDGGLLQRESGDFTWRGVTRPAERTLRFLTGPDGTAEVRFADGRFFHGLDLRSGRHVADHPCSADLYRGEFTVRDEDHWRVVWRVRGPAKDLELVTDHTRADGAQART
ncbi:hypothetical protein GA0115245_13471 [Streptomyces sp. di188]|nr:hypothetical protein GA0115238_13511 [Streptomyces sp. di50b]SCE42085.1 hypothetical protein GA0115245_13471 [Streptomyces sp. di188]